MLLPVCTRTQSTHSSFSCLLFLSVSFRVAAFSSFYTISYLLPCVNTKFRYIYVCYSFNFNILCVSILNSFWRSLSCGYFHSNTFFHFCLGILLMRIWFSEHCFLFAYAFIIDPVYFFQNAAEPPKWAALPESGRSVLQPFSSISPLSS